MAESVDNALLLEMRSLKEIRKEVREQRSLLLKTTDLVRKLDQLAEARLQAIDRRIAGVEERSGDLKDDLEPMIESELTSALGSFEARLARLIEERLGGLRGM